jgi:hypothetical protein
VERLSSASGTKANVMCAPSSGETKEVAQRKDVRIYDPRADKVATCLCLMLSSLSKPQWNPKLGFE